MATTKVFKSGNSMAVRLPASFEAVAGTQVQVSEEQGRWIIETVPVGGKRIDLTGIWGSIPNLALFMPENAAFEDRELDWDGKSLKHD
jgi:antitoxin VapB